MPSDKPVCATCSEPMVLLLFTYVCNNEYCAENAPVHVPDEITQKLRFNGDSWEYVDILDDDIDDRINGNTLDP